MGYPMCMLLLLVVVLVLAGPGGTKWDCHRAGKAVSPSSAVRRRTGAGMGDWESVGGVVRRWGRGRRGTVMVGSM